MPALVQADELPSCWPLQTTAPEHRRDVSMASPEIDWRSVCWQYRKRVDKATDALVLPLWALGGYLLYLFIVWINPTELGMVPMILFGWVPPIMGALAARDALRKWLYKGLPDPYT